MRHGAITRKSQDAELQYQLESANVSHKNIIRSTYDPTRGCSIELIVRRTPPGAGRETTSAAPGPHRALLSYECTSMLHLQKRKDAQWPGPGHVRRHGTGTATPVAHVVRLVWVRWPGARRSRPSESTTYKNAAACIRSYYSSSSSSSSSSSLSSYAPMPGSPPLFAGAADDAGFCAAVLVAEVEVLTAFPATAQ